MENQLILVVAAALHAHLIKIVPLKNFVLSTVIANPTVFPRPPVLNNLKIFYQTLG